MTPLFSSFVFLGMLISTLLIMFLFLKGANTDVEQKEAIEVLLDAGMCVQRSNWHLWKTQREYVLLEFNDKANPLDSTEEHFPADADGRSDAAAKFLRKVTKSA